MRRAKALPIAMKWTAGKVLDLASGYRGASVLAAAADLELFDSICGGRRTAGQIARRIRGDRRAVTIILDALAALGLLKKGGGRYSVPADVASVLTAGGTDSVLSMSQHHANCMRRWAQLARVARTGRPAVRAPSIRGERRDAAAFIGGMHDLSSRISPAIVGDIQPLPFTHILDVGGGSGTWTIAFLAANPVAKATIFDLPHVIPMARRRLRMRRLDGRVRFVAGDFYRDALPKGADLAWVSAIVHQNSREQNRELFRKVFLALEPGGRIAIRDVVMEESRTAPVAGALFAVNMLVGTPKGATYTLRELREDLRLAGFVGERLVRRGEGNDSVVVARRRG
ncbi:MAG TPA: methyltransferase [Candidatus Sulfotelmatobacter sp.]|nr:methyltransferase [Candidatus Sulfotelmatobacter sp.]